MGGSEIKRAESFFSSQPLLCLSVRACRLWWSVASPPQVSAAANRCSNPVSSFTRSVIHCHGVCSCSEIVCMSYFTHVVPCCLPVCLCPQCQVWGGVVNASVSGSSAVGGDDIWPIHKQGPEVIVEAWCITVIELIMQQKTAVPLLTQSQLCWWWTPPSALLWLDGEVIDAHSNLFQWVIVALCSL